ncbi:MAG: universal stress protein [Actinobacteria bacterium]|nr:universal stress protein [Actinomycetota bacterium]
MPIVVGTDGSGESLRAVEWAAAEAARRSQPLRIVLVMAVPAHVPAATDDSPVTLDELMSSMYRQSLADTAERASQVAPGVTITTELLTGSPGSTLTSASETASLLVVGAFGVGGYGQPGAGPDTRYVTAHVSCPVAVIRAPRGVDHGEVAVGVRTAADADATLGFAFEEAAHRRARLTVVHACDEHNPPLHDFAGRLSTWQELFPHVTVRYQQVEGRPGRVLTDYTVFSDVTVVGRHDGPNRSIGHGSTLRSLLNHAQATVVVVPSD